MGFWRNLSAALLGCALVAGSLPASTAEAAESTYDMLFPVVGDYYFSDTWGAARSNGRSHEGTDIMTYGVKGVPVIAVASGTVGWMHDEQGGKCCAMALEHDDGWSSWYIHLNNDTPGTDDGQGWGFAPGIESGVHVEAGDVIAYVGDSGNAEDIGADGNGIPHLHFELHKPDGTAINPYTHLVAAEITDEVPVGWLEGVSDQVESVRVRGWTMDPDTPEPINIHIYVDGKFNTGLVADVPRGDIETAFDNGKLHGFDTIISLEPGTHRVCVNAINAPTRKNNPEIGCKNVTVTAETTTPPVEPEPDPDPSPSVTETEVPYGWVDRVEIENGKLIIRGWAIDEDAPEEAVGVHVYVDGKFTVGGPANVKRADVDRATGLGAHHGYAFDTPITEGSHQVCIHAINLPNKTNNPLLDCTTIS